MDNTTSQSMVRIRGKRLEKVSLSIHERIGPALERATKLRHCPGRFGVYEYLTCVYATYRKWKHHRVARRTARAIALRMNIPWRKGVSPIRILIEATNPSAAPKQKSRWVRALQFASSEDQPTKGLTRFFRARRGIAGCARLAAKHQPKKDRRKSSWDD